MGKAYVFSAISAARVTTMASEFARRAKRAPFRRRASVSDSYQRDSFDGYRCIVDVCGPHSPEIDSLFAAIQESERG